MNFKIKIIIGIFFLLNPTNSFSKEILENKDSTSNKYNFSVGFTYLLHNENIRENDLFPSYFHYENRWQPSLQASFRYNINTNFSVGAGLNFSLRGYSEYHKLRTQEPRPSPKITNHNAYFTGGHLLLRYNSQMIKKKYFFAEFSTGFIVLVDAREKTFFHDSNEKRVRLTGGNFDRKIFFQNQLNLGFGSFAFQNNIRIEIGGVISVDKIQHMQITNESLVVSVGPRLNVVF